MSRPLPRFTDQAITHDPLEAMLAQREAEIEHARTEIAKGKTPLADATDRDQLRGFPVEGFGGTSPGTDPHEAYCAKERAAHRHAA